MRQRNRAGGILIVRAYIVTEKRLPPGGPNVSGWIEHRHAFTDIREAQRLAHHHVLECEVRRSKTEMDSHLDEFYELALNVPEAGGTIGPMPDGTIVTVEPIPLLKLLADPDVRRQCSLSTSNETMLAQAVLAYNWLRS